MRMMPRGLRIFRVHGIEVYVHISWWFIFALLAYSLASEHGFFRQRYPGLGTEIYWVLGFSSAALLFVSVLFHELTHSFVARAHNIKVDHVTLFFFGGVASLPTEDIKPRTEFWMALSGPLFSLILAGLLWLVHSFSGSILLGAVTAYLWQINLMLGLFNLVPGYPLDGGRVFRAVLMFYYHDIRKATYIASWGGKLFGGFLVFLGFVGIFAGAYGGVWFVLLGGFLWFTARASYDSVVLKMRMGKIRVSDILVKKYVVISPTATYDMVMRMFRQTMDSTLFVMRGGKFMGVLELQQLPGVQKAVVNLMTPARQITPGRMNDNGYTLLRKMDEQQLHGLPVIEKHKVKGVVYRGALMHMLELRMRGLQ